MPTDCKRLSPSARKIFDKLKPFYPPDPWNKLRWLKQGHVHDNGWYDLKKSTERDALIINTKNLLGSFVYSTANEYRQTHHTLANFSGQRFGPLIQKFAELAVILHELDFQIEVLDHVEC